MKAVCDKYGALLILDEVMSGMGRTGTLHAWEQENVVPDLQTIGKGLGGGFQPIAGLLVGHRVVDALDKGTGAFVHGHTYQAHPVACAAAAEVQRIVKEQDLMANVTRQGKYLEKLLREGLEDHPNVGNIRGRGLFWGVSFGDSGPDFQSFFAFPFHPFSLSSSSPSLFQSFATFKKFLKNGAGRNARSLADDFVPQIEFVRDKATKQPFDPKQAIAMRIHETGTVPAAVGADTWPSCRTRRPLSLFPPFAQSTHPVVLPVCLCPPLTPSPSPSTPLPALPSTPHEETPSLTRPLGHDSPHPRLQHHALPGQRHGRLRARGRPRAAGAAVYGHGGRRRGHCGSHGSRRQGRAGRCVGCLIGRWMDVSGRGREGWE